MKRFILFIFLVACTSTKKPLTNKSPQAQIPKNPKALHGWYKHNPYEEDDADLISSKVVNLELKADGSFNAYLQHTTLDLSTNDNIIASGSWYYSRGKNLTLKTDSATCRYHYSARTKAERQPVGKGLSRKFTEGPESESEFCKYRFLACKEDCT